MKKVVVITGCSSGIGKVTANLLAKDGYKIWATMRNPTKERIDGLNGVEVEELDVTDQKSVDKAINKIIRKDGKIDVLVNNAGFGYVGPMEEFEVEDIMKQYETNLFGMFRVTKKVIPMMREQKSGQIINISSINGLIPFPLYGLYSSSKFAMETMTEAMSFEVAPWNIRMSLVEPGAFLTGFSNNTKTPFKLDENNQYWPLYQNLKSKFNNLTGETSKNKFIEKLANAERVADLIKKVIESKNPKMRYLIGFDAHFYYWAKKLLPERVWRKLIRTAYGW